MIAAALPAETAKADEGPHRRVIPSTGEPLPVIGLGTYQTFDFAEGDLQAWHDARDVLHTFVDLGGTLVDSSPMYGAAERVTGRLVSDLGVVARLFLATKVWKQGHAAGIAQMERSAALLGRPNLDLMQIHNLVDGDTHAPTLLDWKAAGRIRHWGVTHYSESAYAEVERFLRRYRPDFLQINYSLAEPEAGRRLLPFCRDEGIAVIVNRPFAQGTLFRAVDRRPLPAWAADFGAASWAQFFLKWILADPAVTCAIPATRKRVYLEDNMAAARGAWPDGKMRAKMQEYLWHSV